MYPEHGMTLEVDNGAEQLYVCRHESCGRRLVLSRSGGLTVLDPGDFFALHRGGTPGLLLSATVGD